MPSWTQNFGGWAGANYTLVVDVTLLYQEAVNNRSRVRITAYVRKNTGSGYYTSNAIDNNVAYNSGGWNIDADWAGGYDFRAYTIKYIIQDYDNWVYHNGDGTKTATFGAYSNMNNGTAVTTASILQNYTLPTLATIPTVSTTSASGLTPYTAYVGGNVTFAGNATITQRGIYYSSSSSAPTSAHSRQTVSGTTGSFGTTLTGLAPNTLYYYRAYAINSRGTGYGAVNTFTTSVTPFASLTYSNANPYADGKLMQYSGSSWADVSGSDLYFKTYSAEGATTVAQNSLDPSTMIENAIDFFNAEGGAVTYDGGSSTFNYVTNLVTNPSFETDLTGWTADLGFISKFSTGVQGTYYLNLINSGGGGAGATLTGNLETGKTYTLSYYANKTASATEQITFTHDSTNVHTNTSVTTSWVRYSDTFVATADTPVSIYLDVGASDQSINIDGIMVTEGDTLYDYFDGSNADAGEYSYAWDGTADLSTSTRTQETVSSTIDDTGTVSSYTFTSQTIYEVINKALTLAPYDWYWYVDNATGLIHFHEKSNSADHRFIMGKDIKIADVEKRGEDVINTVYFTGGDTGGGAILYKKYQNSYSIGLYGVRATKLIDERVIDEATAELLANNILQRHALPEVRLRCVIADSNVDSGAYDIESIKVGDIVNIQNVKNSVGTSLWDEAILDVDRYDFNITKITSMNLQVTRVEYQPEQLTITCSTIPPEITKRIEDIRRNLEASQTVNNPDTPS